MTPDPLLDLIIAGARAHALVIHNARGGFASNSSSSHSIVIMPRAGFLPRDRGYVWGEDGYGWQDFCLTESAEKIRYLATMLGDDAEGVLGDRMPKSVADYVDHQSMFGWPLTYGSNDEQNTGFIREFATMLEDPRVAILGGNDGGGDSQYHRPENLILPTREIDAGWTARKDVTGSSWWVLFNRRSGLKLRISLDPEFMYDHAGRVVEAPESAPSETTSTGLEPDKAATPELVDVKLTDRCHYGCNFCYTDSTPGGADADPAFVARIIAALAKLQVFEVAFGGGEPTLWDGFATAVQQCREIGVVPNATTRNWGWAGKNPGTYASLGALAWSVSNDRDFEAVRKMGRPSLSAGARRQYGQPQLSLQAVPAILTDDDLNELFTTAGSLGAGVTLLGYKTTGRGGTHPIDVTRCPDWWIPAWKAHSDRYWSAVAIDTVLAEQCEEALQGEGVPRWSYHTHEGRFSMFIDAITATVGPSSYDPDRMVPIDRDLGVDDLAEAINAAFLEF
jgi:hypothetical protein